MENTNKVTPKDFFLWVAAIAALYVSTVSLLVLWFSYIDRLIGTVDQYMDPFSTGMRIAVASLVIIFPLYIFFTRILHQEIRANAAKKELWIRRWLLMLTLFGAGVVMVIDLIVLLNTFLGGEELTMAFLLKVLSVLVVVGGAFWYYLHEAKGTWDKPEQAWTSQMIGMIVSLIVLTSVVSAFYIIGTPRDLRLLRYDQEKVYALQNIQSQVTTYWQQKQRLPASVDDLKDPLSGFVIPVDPQTAEGEMYKYEYRMTGDMAFEICAVFNHASVGSTSDIARPKPVYTDYYNPENEYWEHAAGRVCFPRTIDPERYPPYVKPVF
ncbi:MAG: hypothetical protein HYT30_01565 [Parcubacteria group bacterium]|nr:hypothetical protein [Parcubacteria group bacterium]